MLLVWLPLKFVGVVFFRHCYGQLPFQFKFLCFDSKIYTVTFIVKHRFILLAVISCDVRRMKYEWVQNCSLYCHSLATSIWCFFMRRLLPFSLHFLFYLALQKNPSLPWTSYHNSITLLRRNRIFIQSIRIRNLKFAHCINWCLLVYHTY
jgi:hypothetical protein